MVEKILKQEIILLSHWLSIQLGHRQLHLRIKQLHNHLQLEHLMNHQIQRLNQIH